MTAGLRGEGPPFFVGLSAERGRSATPTGEFDRPWKTWVPAFAGTTFFRQGEPHSVDWIEDRKAQIAVNCSSVNTPFQVGMPLVGRPSWTAFQYMLCAPSP